MDLMDYRRKIIANSPHLKFASGAVATFSDGADLPLKSLNVDIEPVQSGSGDPSPTNVRAISGWNAVNVKNGNTVIATISLSQTVYGGTLNPLTGVLTVDRAMVDLGTLSWSITGDRFTVATRLEPNPISRSTWGANDPIAICSNYKYGNIGNGNGVDKAVGFYKGILFARDTAYSTAADFKTAVSGVQLVYELATPYEIQLTPHQIRTLYGSNTIFADTGNVALEYWAHA